nr:peptidase [Streptomyces taklimakanensis]
MAAALSSARRRAGRDGERHVDTAHLLHGLVESDPVVRSSLGGPARPVRVLGYLAQRSIGYGLRWRGVVETTPCGVGGVGRLPEVVGPARLAGRAPRSNWSPAAVVALGGALDRARARGAARAEGVDLLEALLADPRCRAVEVLCRAGVLPVEPGAEDALAVAADGAFGGQGPPRGH